MINKEEKLLEMLNCDELCFIEPKRSSKEEILEKKGCKC
jgi:hypothetical protein